jgi:hypothetical protein
MALGTSCFLRCGFILLLAAGWVAQTLQTATHDSTLRRSSRVVQTKAPPVTPDFYGSYTREPDGSDSDATLYDSPHFTMTQAEKEDKFLAELDHRDLKLFEYEIALRLLRREKRTQSSTLHLHQKITNCLARQGAHPSYIGHVIDLSHLYLTRTNHSSSFRKRVGEGRVKREGHENPRKVTSRLEIRERKGKQAEVFDQLLKESKITPSANATRVEVQTRPLIDGHGDKTEMTKLLHSYLQVRGYRAEDVLTAKAQRVRYNDQQRKLRYRASIWRKRAW